MKLDAMIALFGYLAIPACHADSQSPAGSTGSAGTIGSAGATTSNTGSTSSAGALGVAGGAGMSGSNSAAGAGGINASAGGGSGSGGLPPLQECTSKPSIDRLTDWTASDGECTCTPVGDILTKQSQTEVAQVVFTGTDWHVVPVLITNQFGKTADVSSSTGITLTYSATAALHVQARSGSHWDGGDQWAADVPSTSGMKQTLTISFEASKWQSLFGAPALTLTDTLKELQGLVFVGNTANTVVFYGLRIQGFQPACP